MSILFQLLQKSHSALNRPITSMEFRNRGILSTPRLTYLDRLYLNDFGPALATLTPLVFYDIGANLGGHSLAIAKLLPRHTVISFEPIPEVFEFLCEYTRSHPNITCANVALGDYNGSLTFHVNAFHPSSSALLMLDAHRRHFPNTTHSTPIQVPVHRLDDYVRSHNLPVPDVVKIDVQGFEDQVLAGGTQTLAAAEWIQTELTLAPLYANGSTFDSVYRSIVSLGFRIYSLTDVLIGSGGEPLQVNALFRRVLSELNANSQQPSIR